MTQKLILALSCGSSSLKGAAIDNDSDEALLSHLAEKLNLPDTFAASKANGEKHKVDLPARPNHTSVVEALMGELRAHGSDSKTGTIGYRVVSGGELYSEFILADSRAITGIEKCIPLAPLYNPAHLFGLRAVQSIFKGPSNIVVFGTAFHQSVPRHAYTYAIPQEFCRKYSLRRYDTHDTSYRFVVDETTRFLGRDKGGLHMVIVHLGNGTSISAVVDGKYQDANMDLTPLEGLVMGTRSGDIDPAVFGLLAENANVTIAQVADMLSKKSDLLGLSGLSNDCHATEEEAAKGHEDTVLAVEVFVYRLTRYVGNMAIAAGGLDALVFTGGIGKNSELIRSKILSYPGSLGLIENRKVNLKVRFGNAGVTTIADGKAVIVIVPTNEESMTAHDTTRLNGL